MRLGFADEVRYSIVPVLIGEGVPFFGKFRKDIAPPLVQVNPYESGMIELRYEVGK
jgi:hypothetical protein